ncbi:hypothetical protein ZHAS_00009400 [Anopheles sinensis]|uniref:Solute carrier family 66 member 2 n=1 Tax=Anopheles sinensis TaxID=74873 RepID=A0A084VUV0_ANOSI|nr:hypothetical protein ZHAS_00009400 [Anopheles sinensis]
MDWIINDELGLTVGHLVTWSAASFMVVGGVLPYIPQYRQIKQTQDPEGFSLLVCLALLLANSLRILFWFFSRFELPLLVQSVVMNLTMFLMIHLCVNVRRNNAIMRMRERVFSDFDSRYFWQWTDFQSYVDFMLVVWAVGAAITYLMLSVTWFMETIGFLAVFTEAMLGLPQFVRNYKNKSTHGMSICMVIMWTAGDMFKTGYFVLRNAPTQFWICGTLQVSLDLAILLQVYIYRNNNNSNSNKNSIHLHRNHSPNGCPILSSPDSHDTAPILPGRRDIGVGCNRLLGLAPLAAACSSSAASSFYSSMLGAAECSVSLRSRTDRNSLTPGRAAGGRNGRLGTGSKFHHSKSHSISSSPHRETTPVRHSAVISVRGGSEKFSDRQKTASLPLPKRRQLSLSATESNGTGLGELSDLAAENHPSSRGHEEAFNCSSLAGDNCSFDTATSGLGGQQQRRDSSCTLNSNSYKEQYILGCGHYRSNLKHYDALLAGGCVSSEKKPTPTGKSTQGEDLAMVELGEKGRSGTPRPSGAGEDVRLKMGETTSDEKIPTVQPKTHHYPTNAKSLENIL